MAAKKPLTFTLHIGDQQIEKLTEEQLNIMAERLSKAMSLYYANHPDEYELLTSEEEE